MQKNEDNWFQKYQTLKKKITEKNEEILKLKEKEFQLRKDIGLEQLRGNE